MYKKVLYFTFSFIFYSTVSFSIHANTEINIFEQLNPAKEDLPQGFRFGLIPNFAKDYIKENPYQMDRRSINKLAPLVYKDGNPAAIKEMKMAIMTHENNPYGDEVVCYFILYKDNNYAKKEISKLESFNEINRDRTLIITKNNIAILLLIDDTKNFKHISDLKEKFEKILNE